MLRFFVRPAAQPDLIVDECVLCSGCKLGKISRLKRLSHGGQEPLVRTKILPFIMVKLFGEGLGCLYSSIFHSIKWWIHFDLLHGHDKGPIGSAKAIPWPNLIVFCSWFTVSGSQFSVSAQG